MASKVICPTIIYGMYNILNGIAFITDPWCLNILQRLDELKKRNRGRKYFSEEDKKELDAISEEQDKHWEILKKEINKIPLSEVVKRIRINLDNNKLFHFSTRRGIRSVGKGMC